jgi:hypothetical protein
VNSGVRFISAGDTVLSKKSPGHIAESKSTGHILKSNSAVHTVEGRLLEQLTPLCISACFKGTETCL